MNAEEALPRSFCIHLCFFISEKKTSLWPKQPTINPIHTPFFLIFIREIWGKEDYSLSLTIRNMKES